MCLAFFSTSAVRGEVGAFRLVHSGPGAAAEIFVAPGLARSSKGLTGGSPAASASAAISRRRLTSSSSSSVVVTKELAAPQEQKCLGVLQWSGPHLLLDIEEHANWQQPLLGDHQTGSEPHRKV